MNKFPETLKLFRKAEKISQVKLAEMCNVSQGTIAKWENGYQEPDIDTLILLSNILGITIDELVGKQ